ncbi:phosphoglycerate mutase family protein [Aspergillus japonicus CBS 114.51]|uniref:Phosphoglycerate mutase family protein n=1 Tax=Aspergillus japonicus CBS 114.51 TaxID=1448312 RepID=A0A8T8XG56_ASPJA|nr:phosphoglycerate mutase family protein [Aspergillus japonicus CBS 114.51]RAH86349.1 phosphoglycerate mutase family protein [Aspergillus japonicus CBS 114.51]
MAPRLHLVRHAEGVHNLGMAYWSLVDPPLTDQGREQCSKLRANFPSHHRVELVVASPMLRALATAVESFQPLFDRFPDSSLVALPDLQEISSFPCDIGSELPALKAKTEEWGVHIDWSHVEEGWTSKDGRYKPTREAIQERARAVRRWLYERPETEVAVVTHGAFLHFLTEDWEDSCVYEGTGWANTEYRTYDMTAAREEDEITLVECGSSRARRGKSHGVSSPDEQSRLYGITLQGWEEQGYLLNGMQEQEISNITPMEVVG